MPEHNPVYKIHALINMFQDNLKCVHNLEIVFVQWSMLSIQMMS